MKINLDPVLSSRIKAAWNLLPAAKQAKLAPLILAANEQAVQLVQTGKAPAAAAPHQLMLANTALSDDSDAVAYSLQAGVVIDVGPDGVIWGTGKWEQLDPGWVEAFAVFLESLLPIIGGKHAFVDRPQTIQIPDEVSLGIAGDWGTGDWRNPRNPAASTDVRNHLALLKPEITIHLGDVYYAGTSDEEIHSLSKLWTPGTIGSFSLNSNHEMYSGSKPYFKAIANAPFEKQGGCSYFSLENKNWMIIGPDSAYFSDEDSLYLNGVLFAGGQQNPQNDFLLQKTAQAALNGQKVIILTHHNGLDETGATTNILFEQVMSGFPGGGGPAYWYWGHVHAAVVYKPQGPAQTLCRCCGHGALPWGQASELAASATVEWYEHRSANDPDIPQRVFNGFAVLRLDGTSIQETFYDENGGVAWSRP
ncbi:MAG: hypothetical protein WB555_04060 [Candidatus Korobacteraceae bacterium]